MADTEYTREQVLQQARDALQKTMAAWGGTCAWHADVKAAIAAIDAALPSASLGEQQEAMERAMAAINKRDERIEAVRQWFAQWEQVMPLYLRHEFETAMPWAVAASPASKGAGGGGERENDELSRMANMPEAARRDAMYRESDPLCFVCSGTREHPREDGEPCPNCAYGVQASEVPRREVWGVVHKVTGKVDAISEYEEDVTYSYVDGWERRKGVAYFPPAAGLPGTSPDQQEQSRGGEG